MVQWQPKQLTPAQLEERRLAAARHFPGYRAGRVSLSAIARAAGVGRQAASRWYAVWQAEGRAGLRQRPKTGKPCRLTAAQWDQLAAILERGAVAAGFDTERWTLRRVAVVVTRDLGVRYHFRSLGRVLRGAWLVAPAPARAGRGAQRGRDRGVAPARLAVHKKGARRSGRVIAFLDETGFTFRARVGTTWAPVGAAPILHRISKRREVSSIVAVTAPLDDARPRLYARHVLGAIHGETLLPVLRYFRARIGHPLLLVWDHLSAHRKACVRDFLARHPEDFRVEWLPGYAPELNPEEQCNNCVKCATLNATPESDEALRRLARRSFQRLARQPHLLTHFFAHAGLNVA